MNQKLVIIKHSIMLSHTEEPVRLVRRVIGEDEALIGIFKRDVKVHHLFLSGAGIRMLSPVTCV